MTPERYIITRSGRPISFNADAPCSLTAEDVAAALSNICRWVGHTRGFYSVAQHSLLVAELTGAPPESIGFRAALLHDASEAYLGDVSSPLKRLLPDYAAIERRFQRMIERQFDLSPGALNSATIRSADREAWAIEAWDLMPAGIVRWRPDRPSWPHLKCWSPRKAHRRFLKALRQAMTCGGMPLRERSRA